MVSGFMGSPSWSSGVTEDGDTFVNVSGDISVHEKKVRALLQFSVDQKKGTFKFNALEFNGVPQPLFATAGSRRLMSVPMMEIATSSSTSVKAWRV
jgi:hypothetical protein